MNGKRYLPSLVWLTILFVIILGFADWIMIQYIYEMEWAGNTQLIRDGFWMIAYAAVAMVSIAYYFFTKDKSESIAIFSAFFIMVHMGLQDITFYLARYTYLRIPMDAEMCWFVFPINLVSSFLGEACVSPLALLANVALGAVIAYAIYSWLVKQKW